MRGAPMPVFLSYVPAACQAKRTSVGPIGSLSSRSVMTAFLTATWSTGASAACRVRPTPAPTTTVAPAAPAKTERALKRGVTAPEQPTGVRCAHATTINHVFCRKACTPGNPPTLAAREPEHPAKQRPPEKTDSSITPEKQGGNRRGSCASSSRTPPPPPRSPSPSAPTQESHAYKTTTPTPTKPSFTHHGQHGGRARTSAASWSSWSSSSSSSSSTWGSASLRTNSYILSQNYIYFSIETSGELRVLLIEPRLCSLLWAAGAGGAGGGKTGGNQFR